MHATARTARSLLLACVPFLAACAAGSGGAQQGIAPAAGTRTAIRAEDLRLRLTAFAHDSMQGREAGTPGHDRAVEYLARELERIGLRPAGEDGTFFQEVPLIRHELDRSTTLSVGGTPLRPGDDYAPYDLRVATRSVEGAEVVFAGTVAQAMAMPRERAAGKFLVVVPAPGEPIFPNLGPSSPVFEAAGVGVAGIEPLFWENAPLLIRPSMEFEFMDTVAARPVPVFLSTPAAERMLGRPLVELRPGDTGARLEGDIRYLRSEVRTRNVIAALPGTEERLRGEYVALGAHSDHDGVRWGAVSHDSLRAFLQAVRERGDEETTPAERARLAAEAGRADDAGVRLDSIFNGADDDGSGSIALLEIAEWFAAPENRPDRSLLFVWHTAEEKGLHGSAWFTDHPTVPRDDVVAMINIDMIGRGGADDLPGGGPDYLQLLGARRVSPEFGALVEEANAALDRPFRLDLQYDAPGHPEQYYCRSDHWNYARYGIPVVFLSTGDHVDYHQVTDEVRYIDFDHYTRVVEFIRDVAGRTAELERRPSVANPGEGPNAQCRQ